MLKLPAAGHRDYSTGATGSQGTYGYYWSSSPYSTDARYLYFSSTYVNPAYDNYRAYGFTLRFLQN